MPTFVARAIAATFVRRGTRRFRPSSPIGLTDEFAADPSRQANVACVPQEEPTRCYATGRSGHDAANKAEPVLIQAATLCDGLPASSYHVPPWFLRRPAGSLPLFRFLVQFVSALLLLFSLRPFFRMSPCGNGCCRIERLNRPQGAFWVVWTAQRLYNFMDGIDRLQGEGDRGVLLLLPCLRLFYGQSGWAGREPDRCGGLSMGFLVQLAFFGGLHRGCGARSSGRSAGCSRVVARRCQRSLRVLPPFSCCRSPISSWIRRSLFRRLIRGGRSGLRAHRQSLLQRMTGLGSDLHPGRPCRMRITLVVFVAAGSPAEAQI